MARDARSDRQGALANVVRREGDRIVLSGELRTRDAAPLWRALRSAARDVPPGARIEIDLSDVPAVDDDVMALLVELASDIAWRGGRAELTNLRERVAKLAALHVVERPPTRRTRRRPERALGQIGAAVVAYATHVKGQLGFLGSLLLVGERRRRRPRASHWREIVSLLETTGADAMPVVFSVLFVTGFIFAYSTADEFIKLGQKALSADLIGRGMSREVAPVMTAIILGGRSGAAFTAELGTMKINHEIDALRTLGLDPFAWLVVPRVFALVVALPALTLVADFFGFGGGALVAVTTLRLELPVYVRALERAVSMWDVESGLIKSAAFGFAIALIACQQGFAASAGPEDVGRRTTATVVACFFFVFVIDAVFTVLYRSFGG